MTELAGYAVACVLAVLLLGLRRTSARQAPSSIPVSRAARDRPDEAFLSSLLAASEASILLSRSDGVILRCNDAARQLFGGSGSDLVGKSVLEATLSADLEQLLHVARTTSAETRAEIQLSGPKGALIAATVAPVPIEGEPPSFVFVAQSISEVRRLETVRRDFVANVSHELRTPLASIRAMAETLRDGARTDDKVADRFLDSIVTESERLTRIADDLLVLSRAESQPPAPEPVNVSELAPRVVEQFRKPALRAGLALEASVPADLWVLANSDKLEQVAANLVENAIKYTPSGGTVTVEAERRGGSVSIRVTDTGIGILQEHLPRLFERFYRVDKARSRESGGTGLGLSIVKHIVESYGGSVLVKSELNRGSTFEVLLPSAPKDSGAEASSEREGSRGG